MKTCQIKNINLKKFKMEKNEKYEKEDNDDSLSEKIVEKILGE